MSTASDYDSEVFRLAVAAGFYHPDPESRQDVHKLLEQWLSDLGDAPDASEIRSLISTEQGTTIEPFVLTKDDLDCAVFLAQAAFAAAAGQTRFRIVSRETIGHEGGLVLTNNLKSYYSERYIHGKHRHQQSSGWAFVPSAIPTGDADGPAMIAATISSDDEGFRIVVSMPECREDPAIFARQLQRNSRIKGVKDSFSSLGLRVECHDGEIHVLSGSPESMIRIMAYMVEGTTLILKGGHSASQIPLALVRLDVPEDGSVPVPALIGSTSSYASWMSGDIPSALFLKKPHKLSISNWLRPHPQWIDSVFATLS